MTDAAKSITQATANPEALTDRSLQWQGIIQSVVLLYYSHLTMKKSHGIPLAGYFHLLDKFYQATTMCQGTTQGVTCKITFKKKVDMV